MKRKLNITIVKNAKPKQGGKPKKYADGGGLHLLVNQKGKYWRYNYKFNDKFKTLALGVYPDISLKDARLLHEDARELLARDIDPSAYKKINKATKAHLENTSFEGVGREWFIMWKDDNTENHANRTLARLENDVFPWLGERHIAEIEPPEILMVLRRVESRGALETAHRIRQVIGQVFRYAVATGRAQRDQTADLKGALKPYRKKHFPAITDPVEIGRLLRVIDDYSGSLIVRCAFKLSPLVMLRPNELAGAEWQEIDLDTKTWTIPIARMKAKKALKDENASSHIIPLSNQAVEVFKEIQPLTGWFQHVFTGARNRRKPMSSSSVNTALKRLGYAETMKGYKDKATIHGFRSVASTALNESGEFSIDVIERQLAHVEGNAVRRAYNHAQYLPERETA